MESFSLDERQAKESPQIRNSFKVIFAIILAGVAGLIAYMQIFRIQPPQSTVAKAFDLVEKGDIEGVMQYVDPTGQLGTIWDENQQGVRDTLSSFVEKYRLDFSSLKFKTRMQKDSAEVELTGGKLTIYSQQTNSLPVAVLDLRGSNLVFYLERKEGHWLIEGVNYDLSQIPPPDQLLSPF